MIGPVCHCLGPVVLDRILDVDKLPGADDKAFVRGQREAIGGPARNVVAALVGWGRRVSLSSVIGDDPVGATLLNQLTAAGIASDCIDIVPDLLTATTLILVDQTGERAILIEPIAETVLATIGSHLTPARGDAVITNFFHPDAVSAALATARRTGALGVIDLEWPEITRWGWDAATGVVAQADLVVTNTQVMRAFAEREGMEPGWDAARALAFSLRPVGGRVCVTLGSQGFLARGGDREFRGPALPVRPRDTTGAGDRFLAGLVNALLAGEAFGGALRHALAAAGLFLRGDAHEWHAVQVAAVGLPIDQRTGVA